MRNNSSTCLITGGTSGIGRAAALVLADRGWDLIILGRHGRAEADSRRHPLELSPDEAQRLFDQVTRANPRVFVPTGGDPMMGPDLLEIIEWIRPSLWSVFQLVPTGRASSADMLSAVEMEALFERLAELATTVPHPIKTTEGRHFRRVQVQRWLRDGKPWAEDPGCHLKDEEILAPVTAA